jgi:hypothetical protein
MGLGQVLGADGRREESSFEKEELVKDSQR